MRVTPVKTRLFKESEELAPFICAHIQNLKNGSVLVISSKIISLSEGRTAPVSERERLIRKESTKAVKTKMVWLTVNDGIIMANAGIDESNANGKLILVPKDSYKTAARTRSALKKKYKIKNLGVVIADSVVVPLRQGVVGVALGYAGFKGVRNYRGKKDLFGRKFKFASSNIADSLATAAMVTMGEGSERQPLAIIENAPVQFSETVPRKEITVSLAVDMFAPILKGLGLK